MPAQNRYPTGYKGVYYIIGKHLTTGKPEKIYYITYRKDGKLISEKAGRSSHDWTPAKANALRGNKISGKVTPNVEQRKAAKESKDSKKATYIINKLWDTYCESNPTY